MVARLVRDQEVVGSSPVTSTIFVVRKSYKQEKAHDTPVSCAFLYAYLVFLSSGKIFEFNSCILALLGETGLELTTLFFG